MNFNIFKNLKIKTQLILGFVIVISFVVMLGIVSYIQNDNIQHQIETLYEHPFAVRLAASQIRHNISNINNVIKNTDIRNSTTSDLNQIELLKVNTFDQISILNSQYLGPKSDVDSLKNSFILWNTYCAQVIQSKSTIDITENKMDDILNRVQVIDNFADNKSKELYDNSVLYQNTLNKQLIVLTIIILILSIIVIYSILYNIQTPLNELITVTRKFHFGELDIRSSYKIKNEFGELSDSFNEMAEKIKKELEFDKNTILSKNKELEDYLYTASHDLRSPLINIQGFSQRLQTQIDSLKKILSNIQIESDIKTDLDKITDENIPKSINYISSNVVKMDILLNGLLQISRTGLLKMNIKKIDMNELIKKITNSLNFEITKYSANILINDLQECYGDENLLNQLFSNIIGNALKYRDKDRQLIIGISSYIEHNKVIYIIKDTGIGIEPKHLNKIWDVFYRVNSDPSELGEGIGLSLAKTITNKHRGRIWVESDKDKGSVFYVELLKNKFSE